MTISRLERLSIAIVVLAPVLLNAPAMFGVVASDTTLLYGGFTGKLDWNPARGYPNLDWAIGRVFQAHGFREALEIASGRVLWWNPFEGAGYPTSESMQATYLFPPSLLLGFGNGVAIELCTLEVLAGIATWLLVREIGLGIIAAALAGVAFSINGTFSWLGPPWINPTPFLPLLILGVERLKRGAFGGWALVAISLALSIVAAHPETAYLDGLLAFAWTSLRFVQARNRVRFAVGLTTSAACGLMMAAPAIVGFLDYLPIGDTMGHVESEIAKLAIGLDGIPQLLMPYVWGPINNVTVPDGHLWARVGGYAGTGLSVLAFAAAFGPTQRTLRALLLAWVLLALMTTFNAPFIHDAVLAVPLVKVTAYFRYLPSSWEFALAILAAFAVDDMQVYRTMEAQLRGGIAIVLCTAVTITAVVVTRIGVGDTVPYRTYVVCSLFAAGAVVVAIGIAVLIRSAIVRSALIAGIVAGELSGYYLVAQSAYPRSGTLDMAPIKYLQNSIGYQRFYTLGPIAPNFGTALGIASINNLDVPVPSLWVKFIHMRLDPYANGAIFVGADWSASPGVPTRAQELRDNVSGYESAGVRFVVSPLDENPFDRTFDSHGDTGAMTATLLTNSTKVRLVVRHPFTPATLTGIDVFQGNFFDGADGSMDVRVCDSRRNCASGQRSVLESKDNTFFHIEMKRPIKLDPPTLTVTFTNPSSKQPDALWAYPADSAGSAKSLFVDDAEVLGKTLRVRFDFEPKPGVARLVFHDQTLSIFELIKPRPYAAAPGCRLSLSERTVVEATCSAATDLHRLELFMPGWHADVNGHDTNIALFDGAFQLVRIPAGRSVTRFWFRPPFIEYGFAALAVGLSAVCVSLIGDGRRRRAKPTNGLR